MGCHQSVLGFKFKVPGWVGEGIRVDSFVEAGAAFGGCEAVLHPVIKSKMRSRNILGRMMFELRQVILVPGEKFIRHLADLGER